MMKWLLLAVVGWSALGIAGVALSFSLSRRHTRHRENARKHVGWLVVIWALYGAALAMISVFQPVRVVPIGADQCFGKMCFAVTGMEETPAFWTQTGGIGTHGKVLRVTVRVSNYGTAPASEDKLAIYMQDAQRRRWEPLAGLSGNALTTRVAPGSQILSEPVFRVAEDSTRLEVVFTHGLWQPGSLIIGDSDSLGHKRTVVRLTP